MIVTIAQCLCQKHEKGQAPTPAMKSPASKARLHLIESIIDERMVAPNVHKRVLFARSISISTSTHQGKNRETYLSKPGLRTGI